MLSKANGRVMKVKKRFKKHLSVLLNMIAQQFFLLDTNVLVHLVRGSRVWNHLRDAYKPLLAEQTPRHCSVTAGEFRSLALQWNWGDRKLNKMEFCLSFFQSQTIEHLEMIRAYAVIDSYCESIGQSL